MESLLVLLQTIHVTYNPTMIIIKSKVLCQLRKSYTSTEESQTDHTHWMWYLQSTAKDELIQRRDASASTTASSAFECEASDNSSRRKYHPLKMPQRYTNEGIAICRFHNYGHRNGCLRFRDTHNLGKGCALDHEHCHSCLQRGQILLNLGKLALKDETTTVRNPSILAMTQVLL